MLGIRWGDRREIVSQHLLIVAKIWELSQLNVELDEPSSWSTLSCIWFLFSELGVALESHNSFYYCTHNDLLVHARVCLIST